MNIRDKKMEVTLIKDKLYIYYLIGIVLLIIRLNMGWMMIEMGMEKGCKELQLGCEIDECSMSNDLWKSLKNLCLFKVVMSHIYNDQLSDPW